MLTPKQARFVDEYLVDLNASQAAIRANYSSRNAKQIGAQLLQKKAIKDAVATAKVNRAELVRVDADFVLQRLVQEVEADVADLYDANNNLKPVGQWPKIWRTGLVLGLDTESIKVDGVEVGVRKKLRFSDRLRRLELIGKHISVNAFQEQVQHASFDTLGDRLERANARLADASKRER